MNHCSTVTAAETCRIVTLNNKAVELVLCKKSDDAFTVLKEAIGVLRAGLRSCEAEKRTNENDNNNESMNSTIAPNAPPSSQIQPYCSIQIDSTSFAVNKTMEEEGSSLIPLRQNQGGHDHDNSQEELTKLRLLPVAIPRDELSSKDYFISEQDSSFFAYNRLFFIHPTTSSAEDLLLTGSMLSTVVIWNMALLHHYIRRDVTKQEQKGGQATGTSTEQREKSDERQQNRAIQLYTLCMQLSLSIESLDGNANMSCFMQTICVNNMAHICLQSQNYDAFRHYQGRLAAEVAALLRQQSDNDDTIILDQNWIIREFYLNLIPMWHHCPSTAGAA